MSYGFINLGLIFGIVFIIFIFLILMKRKRKSRFNDTISTTFNGHHIALNINYSKFTLYIDNIFQDNKRKLFSLPLSGTTLYGKVDQKKIRVVHSNMILFFAVDFFVDGKKIKSKVYR